MTFHMSTKRVVTTLLAVAIVATSAIGFSLAYLNYQAAPKVNHLTLAASDSPLTAVVTEPNWDPDKGLNLYPGTTVPKDPYLINTSTSQQGLSDGTVDNTVGNEYGALQVVYQGQTNVIPTAADAIPGGGTLVGKLPTALSDLAKLGTGQSYVTLAVDPDTKAPILDADGNKTYTATTAADLTTPGASIWIDTQTGTAPDVTDSYTAAPIITFDMTNQEIAQLFQVIDIPDFNTTDFQMDPQVSADPTLFVDTTAHYADSTGTTLPTSPYNDSQVNCCANGTVYFYDYVPTVQAVPSDAAQTAMGTDPTVTSTTANYPADGSAVPNGILPENPLIGAAVLAAANSTEPAMIDDGTGTGTMIPNPAYVPMPDPGAAVGDTGYVPGLDAISSQAIFTEVLVDPLNADNGTIWAVSKYAPAGINIVINAAVIQSQNVALFNGTTVNINSLGYTQLMNLLDTSMATPDGSAVSGTATGISTDANLSSLTGTQVVIPGTNPDVDASGNVATPLNYSLSAPYGTNLPSDATDTNAYYPAS